MDGWSYVRTSDVPTTRRVGRGVNGEVARRAAVAGVALAAVVGLVGASAPAVAGGLVYRGDLVVPVDELDALLGVTERGIADSAVVVSRLERLTERVVLEGYLDARLELRREDDDLVLTIDAGAPVRIQAPRIDGLPDAEWARAVEPERFEVELTTFDEIDRGLGGYVAALVEAGFPFASATATDFVRDESVMSYRVAIDPGPVVRIDSLHVDGLEVTRPSTVYRLCRFRPGARYRESLIPLYRERLARSGLFLDVAPPSLLVGGDPGDAVRDGILTLTVTEKPFTTIHGILGVGGRDRELTGLFDVRLDNLFGTARRFHARWEGRGQGRATYEIDYREPWIAGWPVALDAGFHQDQEDTLYTRTDWRLDVSVALTERVELRTGWQVEQSSRPVGELEETERRGNRFGFGWNGRDVVRGRGGAFVDVTATRGTERDRLRDGTRATRDVTTLESRIGGERVWGARTLFVEGVSYLRESPGQRIRAETAFRVGGATSLRGFEEGRFRTDLGGVLTLEARRYLDAGASRVHLFVDTGYFDPDRSLGVGDDRWKIGIGVGMRVRSRVGLVGVDLAGNDEITSYEELRVHLSILGSY